MTTRASATTTERLVAPLATFGRGDLATAGGKGANLGELIRAGFPVPPGFVVTTAAYDRFVAIAGLIATIQVALKGLDVSNPAALNRASETIRDAFTRAAVP